MRPSDIAWQGKNFSLLFFALLLYVLASPIVALTGGSLFVEILGYMLLGALLITAIRTLSRSPSWRWTVIALGVAAVALNGTSLMMDSQAIDVADHLIFIAFLIAIAALALAKLLSSRSVNYETIAASLCVYILLIVAWADAYSLLELLLPGSFNLQGEPAGEAIMLFGTSQGSLALYYSMVTMTTLGYGDITPMNEIARMAAAMQAFVGQVYIAVLVARLVGLQISQATASD